MQPLKAVLCTLVVLGTVLLAGIQLTPSLQAHTRRMLEDWAHRRLLEQQDPDHMDIAGLTSHRRLTASHRSHFRHHARERIMQADAPGLATTTTPSEAGVFTPPAADAGAPSATTTMTTGTGARTGAGAGSGSTSTAAGPAGEVDGDGTLGASPESGGNMGDFGFGDTVSSSAGTPAQAPSTTVGTAQTPGLDNSGAVTGTVRGTGSAGGVFIPAGK